MGNTYVFRLGHRFGRDKRISTHLALVARAWGARAVIFDVADDRVKNSVYKICDNWGYGPKGNFEFIFEKNWRKFVKNFEGISVHLTMYGLPLSEVREKIKKLATTKNILVIVGGQKVPGEMYGLVDYNVGVGNQPHSEVGALAVFLNSLNEDALKNEEWACKENKGKIMVFPQEKGKKVVER
ncbi:MAG: tRNA (cytidine(56)-2'-O)-methyltransferase [Euryarchaeota archaeon HGW-Euryarchaeota-1]|nr:MAG: tRNA (cytidine(56)-2'-O)-methyltransferase [Euryarchaeota archaeon HGW-Euryarchaeota-1]